MPNGTSISDFSHHLRSIAKRFAVFRWSGRRLMIVASALHVLLAIGLFIVARVQIAPAVVDSDGIMTSFAFDSYDYQRGAVQLAELLQNGKIAAWLTAAEPMHVKIIAVLFALFGPVFGYGPLSAEPYNVLCYTAVVGLAFLIGREVHSRRTGLLAGAAVAVWPTFLLHTMQLLKDPLFVAGSLLFLFCVTTWLTRSYNPILGAGAAVLTMLILLLLFLVRSNGIIVILVVGLLGFALLVMRQLLQRRLLLWNTMSAVVVLITALLFLPFYSSHVEERTKLFPPAQSGLPKSEGIDEKRVASSVVRVASTIRPKPTDPLLSRSHPPGDRLARRISSMRSRFAASYPESGSGIDGKKEFSNLNDLLGYVPRAMEIGLWAPFPSTWFAAGRRVGNAGKLLAAGETFLIYLCQLFALMALVREPRRWALWFLFAIATLGVTALAFLVPNIGALYRFRYTFWILVIITAMAGLDDLLSRVGARSRKRQETRQSSRHADAAVVS